VCHASVVTSSYEDDSFKVRVVYLNGEPRANKKTFITYQASALKVDKPENPPTSEPEDPTSEPPVTSDPPQDPATSEKCTNPSKVWGNNGAGPVHADDVGDGIQYYGGSNIWNQNGTVSVTTGVCSHAKWYAEARAKNLGDGAVVAYPNLHKDWIDWSDGKMPRIDSFDRIPLRFAHDGPGNVGIWNWAVDAWINGVGNDSGVTELMIWTEYKGQRPAGSKVKEVTVGGKRYDLWTAKQWGIVSYVAKDQVKSGTLDIRDFTDHMVSEG